MNPDKFYQIELTLVPKCGWFSGKKNFQLELKGLVKALAGNQYSKS